MPFWSKYFDPVRSLWLAQSVARSAGSDTVRYAGVTSLGGTDERILDPLKKMWVVQGRGDSGRFSSIHCFTQRIVASSACSLELNPFTPSLYTVIPKLPLRH